ncbi:MAG: glycoside hydrolase family 71/99-like protein [Phycisphaeraceae bacterium]|nr:glycoside hydrolase family 71/99-like protein [Phycisphaeraceae bacterium]
MPWRAFAILLCLSGSSFAQRDGLSGRVFVGYQGWFRAPGDGADAGWHHYKKKGRFKPGFCTIDLWPDVSELGPGERFKTAFRHADGRVAEVFSSHHPRTVSRHFQWMKDFQIDGAFVQRFATRLRNPKKLKHWNTVLNYCRSGARQHGRRWALMYDLSGLKAGEVQIIHKDWSRLRSEDKITDDASYLRHRHRPLVAVWGVGFADGRDYSLGECEKLIDFFKSEAGGRCSVLLAVPFYFRERKREAVRDAALHRILRKADVIQPWSVGRYRDVPGALNHTRKTWEANLAWCLAANLDHMPVVFPGFSWKNLKGGDAKLGQIPRQKGRFYWSQFIAARRSGAKTVYVAMFDEIDEATAIFKCTNDPPVGVSSFLTYEGLPTDHYLWLTQEGRKLLRRKTPPPAQQPMPQR